MAHEIEADFKEDWDNEETSCKNCTSYNQGYCNEAKSEVPVSAHCDFFQSID